MSFLPIGVSLELTVGYSTSNVAVIDYTIIATQPALDFVADAAELGNLTSNTAVTGGTPLLIDTLPDPAAIGLTLGNFLGALGTGTLTLSSIDFGTNTIALLTTTQAINPAASTVEFNWGGLFQMDLIIISTRRCSPAGSTEPDPNGTQCPDGTDTLCSGTDECVGGGIIVNQNDCTFTTVGSDISFDVTP